MECVRGLFQRQESRPEITLPPLSAETQKLVEHMTRDGYAVYDTLGKSPAVVRAEGMKFWFLDPKLEDVTVAPALVAFKTNPSELFLKGSQNISHEEQVKLLEEEKARVAKLYPDAGLVVREGKLPEWIELSWRHFKETPQHVRLFGKDFGYNYTWTDTYESDQPGAYRADFGNWRWMFGADANLWHPDGVHPHVGLASLVEIPRK